MERIWYAQKGTQLPVRQRLRPPAPQTRMIVRSQLFHTDAFSASAEAISNSRGAARSMLALESPSWVRGAELNTGLFLMTAACLKLANAWRAEVASDKAFTNWMNDQQALNRLVAHNVARVSLSSGGLLEVFGQTLRLGVWPAHLFPSGHVFFIQRVNAALATRPVAIHLTFQNCDQSGKRHRMREALLWEVDPPEHYRPAGGLLSYSPDLPDELTLGIAPLHGRHLRASDGVLAAHFKLVRSGPVVLHRAHILSVLRLRA